MRLFKTFFVVPAASLLFATVAGSGACSSSSSSEAIVTSTPPMGTTFVGGTFGAACMGMLFTTAETGYAVCDDDKWAYTTDDPETAGYTPYTPSVADAAPVNDSGPPDETDSGQFDGRVQGSEAGKDEDATATDAMASSGDSSVNEDGGQQGLDSGQRGTDAMTH